MSSKAKTTESLGVLRKIEDNELELILEWRNSPIVRNNMYTRHLISIEEHLAWWESVRNSTSKKYFIYAADNKPAGVVGFTDIDPRNSNCSWAFYAAPDAPRGSGVRMELLALDHALLSLGLNKIFCEVLDFNSSVISMHKKFGFKEEGIFREQHFVDGTFVNVIRLGLLQKEWAGIRDLLLSKLVSR